MTGKTMMRKRGPGNHYDRRKAKAARRKHMAAIQYIESDRTKPLWPGCRIRAATDAEVSTKPSPCASQPTESGPDAVRGNATDDSALQATAQAQAQAACAAEIAALSAEIGRLRRTIGEYEVETLVDLALKEGRMLPMMRAWAMMLGRKDIEALRAFVNSSPQLHGAT